MYPQDQSNVPAQQAQPEPELAPAPPQSSIAPTSDPGKTMAIIGLILAFFFAILGLVLSVIARKKSKAAGYTNNIALVGIILNSISLVVGLIVAALLALSLMSLSQSNRALGNNVQVDPDSEMGRGIASLELTEETYNARANAKQLVQRANNYKQHMGDFPKTLNNFKEYQDTQIPTSAEMHVSSKAPTKSSGTQAYYQYCGTNSAQVLYYDHSKSTVGSLGLGMKTDGDVSCK